MLHALAFTLLSPLIASPTARSQLFYLEHKDPKKDEGACTAKLYDLASAKTRELFEAPACPSHVIWNAAKARVIYVASDHVWIRSIDDAKAPATDLGKLPAGELQALYLVAKTRNVRAATLVPVADKDVVTKGDKVSYRFEGKEIVAEGVPPWGVPYMALLFELDAKGAWKRVQVKPTKWEAGDTLGIDVLDMSDQATDVASLGARLKEATCAGGKLDCSVDDKAVKKLVGADEESSAGIAKAGAVPFVAFKVMFGDSPHAVPPLFACNAVPCAKGTKLNVSGDQLGISVDSGSVLVTEEYTGAAPVVFDASGMEIMRLPRAKAAVWFPAVRAPDPALEKAAPAKK